MFVPILAKSAKYQAPLDTPYAIIGAKEIIAIRNRFHISEDEFAIFLLGEDGEIKLRSDVPVSIAKLNSLIDSMPDRKVEMERPHSN
ncbi:DUF4174 domain-containing protein [Acidobacterium sp. S8]|uniref:DUF4174 domain-containing protein n=1 Tax=Acidobacterium sp. S8 TaxID=1641854 RepID=UPI00131BA466|nr:DUF4174 domain-containing protein [Acidobacterium sp. S8]